MRNKNTDNIYGWKVMWEQGHEGLYRAHEVFWIEEQLVTIKIFF